METTVNLLILWSKHFRSTCLSLFHFFMYIYISIYLCISIYLFFSISKVVVMLEHLKYYHSSDGHSLVTGFGECGRLILLSSWVSCCRFIWDLGQKIKLHLLLYVNLLGIFSKISNNCRPLYSKLLQNLVLTLNRSDRCIGVSFQGLV